MATGCVAPDVARPAGINDHALVGLGHAGEIIVRGARMTGLAGQFVRDGCPCVIRAMNAGDEFLAIIVFQVDEDFLPRFQRGNIAASAAALGAGDHLGS